MSLKDKQLKILSTGIKTNTLRVSKSAKDNGLFLGKDVKEAILEFKKEINLHNIGHQVTDWNIEKCILKVFGDFEK